MACFLLDHYPTFGFEKLIPSRNRRCDSRPIRQASSIHIVELLHSRLTTTTPHHRRRPFLIRHGGFGFEPADNICAAAAEGHFYPHSRRTIRLLHNNCYGAFASAITRENPVRTRR